MVLNFMARKSSLLNVYSMMVFALQNLSGIPFRFVAMEKPKPAILSFNNHKQEVGILHYCNHKWLYVNNI